VVSIASNRVRTSSTFRTGDLSFRWVCFGPRTAWAGFTGRTWPNTIQSNQIRSAANRCFHSGLGMLPELVLKEGGNVDRLSLDEILDAMRRTERGELPNRFHLVAAGVLVADVAAEEVPHPLPGLRLGGEDGGREVPGLAISFSCHRLSL
jgi:hypothetical protein